MKKKYIAIFTRKKSATTVNLYYEPDLATVIKDHYCPDKSPYNKKELKDSPFKPSFVQYDLTDDILEFTQKSPRYSSEPLSERIKNLLHKYFENAKSLSYDKNLGNDCFFQLINSLKLYHCFFQKDTLIHLQNILESIIEDLLFSLLSKRRNHSYTINDTEILSFIEMHKKLFYPFKENYREYIYLSDKRIISSQLNQFYKHHTFNYLKKESICPEIDYINTFLQDYWDCVESAGENRDKLFNFLIYQYNTDIIHTFSENFHLYSPLEIASQLSIAKMDVYADELDEKAKNTSLSNTSHLMYTRSELYSKQKLMFEESNSKYIGDQSTYFSPFLLSNNLFNKLSNTTIFQFTDFSQLIVMELAELYKTGNLFKTCLNCGSLFPLKSNAQKYCNQCARQKIYDNKIKLDYKKKLIRKIRTRYSVFKSRNPSYAKQIDKLKSDWETAIKPLDLELDPKTYSEKVNQEYKKYHPNIAIKKLL